MSGRSLRFAGVAAAAALLAGGAIWWMLRGAAGGGPEADGGTTTGSAGAGPAVPAALYPPTLEAAGVIMRPLAVGSAQIEGTVRLGTKPTAARVLAYVRTSTPGDEPAVASADADDDGRFVVPRLPAGSYELLAQDAQGRRGGAIVTVALSGQRVGCEIRLREGKETLRGRVIDVGGRPWRGRVTVLARTADIELPAREIPSVETDAEGRFVLERLEPGRAAPHGWDRTGLSWTLNELDVPSPRDIVVDLGVGTRVLTGAILDAVTGQPIVGAFLATHFRSHGGFDGVRQEGASGADGRFQIRIPAGSRDLSVVAPSHAPAWVDLRRTESAVSIRLVRTGRITGRVIREPGASPVGGVLVTAERLEGEMRPSESPFPAVSDATGTYTLEDVTPGGHLLSALGAGVYTPSEGHARMLESSPLRVGVVPGGTSSRDIAVRSAGRIEGIVLDPADAPVAGALVRWGYSGQRVRGGGQALLAASGPDGRFTFETVIADADLQLEADAAGFAGSECEPSEPRVRAGETAEVTLRLGRARHALVTVVDPEGSPIPGAWLSGWKHAVTGADGTALFPWHTANTVRVYASAPSFVEGSGLIEGDGSETPSLRLVLARGLVLAGRVVGASGRPIAGAQVELDGPHRTESVTADGEGRFRAWVAVEGPWDVSARAVGAPWDGAAEVTARAPDESITVVGVERPLGGFPLVVLDPQGHPVPRAKLLVDPESRPRYEMNVPGEGVRVKDPAASVVLEVFDLRDESDQPLPWAPARTERISTDRTEALVIRLQAERAVEGQVVDAAGRGVVGVRLEAVAVVQDEAGDARERSPTHGDAITDGEGRFRLGGLWAGPYRVFVAGGEGFSPPDPVPLDAPGSGVRIAVHPAMDVDVTVVDADARPIPGSQVVARRTDDDSGRLAISAYAEALGVARLERLDPTRRYHLKIEPPNAVGTALGYEVGDWTPASTTVRLPRAHLIAGRVVDDEGSPVPFAEVWAVRGEIRAHATADAQGAFAVWRLVPGTYSVEATTPGDREQFPTLWGKTPTTSGVSSLVVTIPGKPLRIRVEGYDFSNGGGMVSVGLVEGGKLGPWRKEILYRGKEIVFPCLDSANEYAVIVPPGPDGNGAYLGPLRPRLEAYTLRAVPGRVITGRVLLPTAEGEVTLVVAGSSGAMRLADGRTLTLAPGRGNPTWSGAAAANGTFRILGLPEGSFWVTVEARVGGETLRASALEKGEPLEIPIGGK